MKYEEVSALDRIEQTAGRSLINLKTWLLFFSV